MAAGIDGQPVHDVTTAQAALQGEVKDEHHSAAAADESERQEESSERDSVIRVAQIAPNIFPIPPEHHGGTERVIHDLSTALQSLGVEVTLFAPSDSATLLPRIGNHPSLAALERRHGSVPPGMPAALDALQLEALRRRLAEFDIVHGHGEFAHAALLGERRRRSLTTIHWRVDELDRALFFDGFPDLPVAAISAAQEAGIPAANRAGVVHHGIDRDRYAANPAPGSHVAFVGRMTDQKRPDAAIRVARAAACRSGSAARSTSAIPAISTARSARCWARTRSISGPSTTRPRGRCSAAPARCCSRSTGRSRSAS